MALNDDYFDILDALNRLRKDKQHLIEAFNRLMRYSDELEQENKELREKLGEFK